MWILTKEYDVNGKLERYFLHSWNNKPTRNALLSQLSRTYEEHPRDVVINYLLSTGGGRIDKEFHWYYLHEVENK